MPCPESRRWREMHFCGFRGKSVFGSDALGIFASPCPEPSEVGHVHRFIHHSPAFSGRRRTCRAVVLTKWDLSRRSLDEGGSLPKNSRKNILSQQRDTQPFSPFIPACRQASFSLYPCLPSGKLHPFPLSAPLN